MSLSVKLVSYNDLNSWILGKFARRMHESLVRLGVDVEIVWAPDPAAQINHHICYAGFDGVSRGADTLMITHIDDIDKLNELTRQMRTASAGICMSHETMRNLERLGIDKRKLCYVNPAHDGVMPVRKVVVGLACRVQEDGRKREKFLDRLARILDARYFAFRIMGDGWEPQVTNLRSHGFSVDYFDHFDYDEYLKFIPSLDYYLYMGLDEGQMGFIDALAAGVATIVTAQGYHLDAPRGVVHPFTTYEDLEAIMLSLQEKRRELVDSVATWNWDDYARKHLEIWEYLVNGKRSDSGFADGLNSLLAPPLAIGSDGAEFLAKKRRELRLARLSHLMYSQKRWWKEHYNSGGVKGITETILNKVIRRLRRLL